MTIIETKVKNTRMCLKMSERDRGEWKPGPPQLSQGLGKSEKTQTCTTAH
jgi:hypothetical protein